MKKLAMALLLGLALPAMASAQGITEGRDYLEATTSSGAKTADGAIKTSAGIVYGVSGSVVAGAAGLAYICDGDVDDSETAASQLIAVGNVDGADLNPSIPAKGIRFPNGIYLNEKSGNVTLTVYYK